MSSWASSLSRFSTFLLMGWTFSAIAAESQTHAWNFEVYLDNKPIGYQFFTVIDRAREREVITSAHYDVKLLFVSIYRYVHDATEHWQADCLSGLVANTRDGGVVAGVSARKEGGNLVVSATNHTPEKYSGCVMTFAYWNPEILKQSRLLNSQTGEYETIRVEALDSDDIEVRGKIIAARHYRISGPKHPIDLWYSEDRQWLALESTLDGGRLLSYRLQ